MKKIFAIAILAIVAIGMWAVPARPTPFPRVQPNGDTITVRLVGDEHWHATFTVDGYLITKNDKGYFCYAKWKKTPEATDIMKGKVAVPTRKHAKDEGKRSKCEKRWIIRHKIDTL